MNLKTLIERNAQDLINEQFDLNGILQENSDGTEPLDPRRPIEGTDKVTNGSVQNGISKKTTSNQIK